MAQRVDESGAAYAGSQLQTQLYVNRRTDVLNRALRDAFPGLASAEFDWRSPLAEDRYAEYSDGAFLDRIGLHDHANDLKAFWPEHGAHWDALAVVSRPGESRPGVLLAEGKSYPGELYGRGCQAERGSHSRALIEKSLAWTLARLGVSGKTPGDWCGSLYQTANRLAHLEWLRSRGVRAWLVHLLFTDDPHQPTTAAEWLFALEKTNEELGISGGAAPAGAGHVLLPAGTREELIGEPCG